MKAAGTRLAEALADPMQAAHAISSQDPEIDRPTLTLIRGGADFRAQLGKLLPELYRRALRLCRTPARADDLLQETMLRALRFESTFRVGSNMRAWLHQVMYSVFVSGCRRAQREWRTQAALARDPSVWVRGAEAAPEAGVLTASLERAVHSLPQNYREVLVLVDLADHSYRDAAQSLNVPVGTIMSRLHRARRLLRERLEAKPGGIALTA